MKIGQKTLRGLSIVLGFAAIAFFIFTFFLFLRLQPKMTAFEPISAAAETGLTAVGVGLLGFLVFCLLSLLQLAAAIRRAEKLGAWPLILVIGCVAALLLVFADFALLGDIHKQYLHGLSQPEWALVYPITGFQFAVALVLTFLHLSGFFRRKGAARAARDSNIFLSIQYVGLICGLMGLSMAGLAFFFPRGWQPFLHTVITTILLLFPYLLALGYWGTVKLREKGREWLDEKQRQDVGRASFLTLVVVSTLMIILFAASFQNLTGVVRLVWLPLYLFAALFIFSLGTLYYSGRG
jgi:hypothetical protein